MKQLRNALQILPQAGDSRHRDVLDKSLDLMAAVFIILSADYSRLS
jgi:hypothetical protein